jgi:superfamily II DNA or RNA helicase
MFPFLGLNGVRPAASSSTKVSSSEFVYTHVPSNTYPRTQDKTIVVSGSFNVPLMQNTHIERMQRTLTVRPQTSDSFGPPPAPFPVFTRTTHYLRVPRSYGFQLLGIPPDIRTQDGVRIRLQDTIQLRPYQSRAVQRVLQEFRLGAGRDAMLEACCGAGKTVMACRLIAEWQAQTLVIVHKEFLLEQWRHRIASFLPNARVGLVQQQTRDVEDKDIVLCMLQTVLKQSDLRTVLGGAGLCIVDECHHIGARCFSQLFQHLPPVSHRLGLSATPNRADGLGRVVEYLCGPVVCRIRRAVSSRTSTHDDVTVEMINHTPRWVPVTNKARKLLYAQTITRLVKDEARQQLIVDRLRRLLVDEPQRRILVVSERREHLQEIMARMPSSIPIALYVGETSKAGKRIREEEKETAIVLFSTYQMCEEGLDLPSLNTLVLATPKKRLEQVVGRILRGKTVCPPKIIDVVDQVGVFIGMSRGRLNYYRSNAYIVV